MNITRLKKYLRSALPLAVVASLALTQPAGAAPNTWNVGAGGNWSTTGNWSLSHAPTTTDDVTFGNTAGGFFTTNNITGDVINSLIFDWSNQGQQTLVIAPGKTLTVTSSAVNNLLLVGSAAGAPLTTTLAPAAITGAGGNLVLSGTNDIVVHIGFSATTGSHMATLDLSGLDSLTANVGRLLIGQANAGATVNRPSGTLILAKTNTITLTGVTPQIMLQDSGSNANGTLASVWTLGQVNFINGDTFRLGGQKGNANMGFNGSFSLPSAKFRNADGSSPCSVIDFGYNAAANTGNSTVFVADLSAGSVDMYANLVHIAQGPIGPTTAGNCNGTLTLGAGTSAIGTLEVGYANALGASGTTTGILNVNNSGIFPAGAMVQVSGTLRLARTNIPTGGTTTGTINITGGTVVANTIVSGGGVSAINLISSSPSSTLVISNTAGTLASPIGTFSIADSTLQIPALNGGAVLAVKTLTVGGSANTIKITSIPPIGSYPADFTLINYQNGYTAGTGPLSLAPLPAASPAYSGTLVDAGGGLIQLHLNSGPVANLGMHWTGVSSSDWDLSTYNWTFAGFPTNFFNGSSPLFDDSTTQTNVNLAVAVSPGAITVSNNAEAYTFSGVGNIAGAGSLTKKGTSTLIVANQGVDNIGTVIISSGTLQVGAGGVDGSISAITVTNNSALVVNRSGSLTVSAAIAGTGSLTKTGNGTLILSGTSSYSGTTTVSNGTLQVDGPISGTGAVKISPGAVLAGGGSVAGPVTVGGQINPGSAGVPGTLTANGGLTLSSGSTLVFDLSAANAGNPAFNDSVTVTGNLNLNNNSVTVNFDGAPSGSYTLFTYSGTLSGSFNPTVLGTHFNTVIDTSNTGIVVLNVTGGSGSDLEWASTADSTWDSVTNNWLDLITFLPSNFAAGDSVLLDDSNGVVTTITIPTGVSVAPGTITDNATNNYFTINGAGHITGSTGIAKSGPSTLTVSTANSFSGLVDIQGGILQAGSGTALGTTASGTTVEDGATLDVNGQNIGGEVVTITGAGANGIGALVNNGIGQAQALRQIIMVGDATIGGSGLLGVNNTGGAASLSTSGGAYNLTKTGPNQLTLQNLTSFDPALANIYIQQGILEFNAGVSTSMGDPNYTNFVSAGGTVSFANNSVAWQKFFDLTGDGGTTSVNNGGGATTELDGIVALHGGAVFNVGGTSLTLTNEVGGDGSLTKNGASPLILFGPTTFTGDTIINTGVIRLNGAANLAFSTNLTLNAGTFLTVTGMPSSTFILYADHILTGNGGINGRLTANAGSTISPGINVVGSLLVSNQIVLLGTNIMELDQDDATNDVLVSGLSTITYGGTLSLVNVGSTLTNGASFKLFKATGYSGSFIITPATPGPGQVWDISALNTSGTIKVASATAPSFGAASFVGGNIIFHGTNGVAGTPYHVLTTTNLALPLSSWTPVVTNVFDGSGNFAYTNSASPSLPNHFFIIQVP